MTAIAYRDGIMAADTACLDNGCRYHSPKIIRRHGYLLGAAGAPPSLDGLVRWFFLAPGKPTRPEMKGYEFSLLVVTPKGRIQLWDHRGGYEPIRHRFWSVGSGSHVCLGAMDMGASAVEAVRAAIKWADGCGGRVTTCLL